MPVLSLRGARGGFVLVLGMLGASMLHPLLYGLPGPRDDSPAYLNTTRGSRI